MRVRARAVIAMPLVLPPTVLGFYLLVLLGPSGWLGAPWLEGTDSMLAFSFAGLVIASVIYSFPFAVQPLQGAFESVGRAPLEAAATLGAGPLDAFLSVASPLALRSYLSAAVLGFAHTLGEFGVVLMVGGNMPGSTRVISIAIYEHVETLDYARAHVLSSGLLVFSFLVLLSVYTLNRRTPLVRAWRRMSTLSLNVALELALSGITAVFGPSASGKTTLLRVIASLEPDARGTVAIDGA